MRVPSKGDTVEIFPGAGFVERNHARPDPIFIMEAVTDVEVKEIEMYGEEAVQYRWKARDIQTGHIVEYGVTDIALPYAPMLFQSIEDSALFWIRDTVCSWKEHYAAEHGLEETVRRMREGDLAGLEIECPDVYAEFRELIAANPGCLDKFNLCD